MLQVSMARYQFVVYGNIKGLVVTSLPVLCHCNYQTTLVEEGIVLIVVFPL